MSKEFEKIYEQLAGDGGGSSIQAQAPEKVIEISNGDETKTLKERLELRKQLNEKLEEAILSKRLLEELDDKDSDVNLARYQLQKFTNGGTPKGDGEIDGEVGGPSEYEAWRMGINDKKRRERAEQENRDRELNDVMGVPRTSKMPKHMLDFQEDEFLYQWMQEKKNDNGILQESLIDRIDSFLDTIDD